MVFRNFIYDTLAVTYNNYLGGASAGGSCQKHCTERMLDVLVENRKSIVKTISL